MAHINSVVVSGRLTRDPENFGKESPVVKFGMAVNRRYKPKDAEEYTEETSFFDVVVFGNFGGLVARKLRKANDVTVMGRLKQETWETEDGNRSKVVIIADQIDSAAFFQKDEDVPALASGESVGTDEGKTSPDPAKDDIPF